MTLQTPEIVIDLGWLLSLWVLIPVSVLMYLVLGVVTGRVVYWMSTRSDLSPDDCRMNGLISFFLWPVVWLIGLCYACIFFLALAVVSPLVAVATFFVIPKEDRQ